MHRHGIRSILPTDRSSVCSRRHVDTIFPHDPRLGDAGLWTLPSIIQMLDHADITDTSPIRCLAAMLAKKQPRAKTLPKRSSRRRSLEKPLERVSNGTDGVGRRQRHMRALRVPMFSSNASRSLLWSGLCNARCIGKATGPCNIWGMASCDVHKPPTRAHLLLIMHIDGVK